MICARPPNGAGAALTRADSAIWRRNHASPRRPCTSRSAVSSGHDTPDNIRLMGAVTCHRAGRWKRARIGFCTRGQHALRRGDLDGGWAGRGTSQPAWQRSWGQPHVRRRPRSSRPRPPCPATPSRHYPIRAYKASTLESAIVVGEAAVGRSWLHGARTSALLRDHGIQVGDPFRSVPSSSAAEVGWPVWDRCPVGGWLPAGSLVAQLLMMFTCFLG